MQHIAKHLTIMLVIHKYLQHVAVFILKPFPIQIYISSEAAKVVR